MTQVTLSLISHTNVGKTTLVRTLTRRDVGEAFDAAHVTDESTSYLLVSSGDDDLILWDTPGFGDSRRLLARLQQESTPIGWMLHQVWDRLTDRARFCSQEAARNARDEADVILYLINAMETPDEAGYIDPELRILEWIGKPVVFVLNQTAFDDSTVLDTWKKAATRWPQVRDVLLLDAFTRCWVQEDALLNRVAQVIPQDKQAAMTPLLAEWKRQNREAFDRSVMLLASHLVSVHNSAEPLSSQSKSELKQAFARLKGRLDRATDDLTTGLLQAHGLSGRTAAKVTASLENVLGAEAAKAPNKGIWAVVGGVASGAASGLVADFLAGGLTFGGGAVLGALVGGLASTGAAAAYTAFTRSDTDEVRWNRDFLAALTREAFLRYLAVAHHGRGRGDFSEISEGSRWLSDLDAALSSRATRIQKAIEDCGDAPDDALVNAIQQALTETLERRYGPIA